MATRSSTASRVLVCLVALLVCGAWTVGIVAAATGGSASLETDDGSLTGTVDETDDEIENATNDTDSEIENATNETTDGSQNATDDTTDGTGEAVDETTDEIDETVDEPTDPLENGTETATDVADTITDETTDTVDNVTNETAGTVDRTLDNSSGAVAGSGELNGSIGSGSVDLEASASASTGSSDDTDEGDTAGATDSAGGVGGGGAVPDGSSSATDAVLVGLLGTITAAGAASAAGGAAGAGAGVGASTGAAAGSAGAAGTSAGGAAAGGATGLAAKWLGQSSVLRYLRRVGSLVPWKLVPIFRYSRYDDSDPLENDRRRTIYETVADDPGCYLSEVSERSGVALSTVRHHVRVLEEEGLVAAAKVNGKRRYFLEDDGMTADDGDAIADVELHAALAEPAKREVLETLADLGSAPNGRLADELERDPSTVSHHLSALEEDGLVVREKDGRSVVNELVPAVETTLRSEDAALEDVSAETSASAPADD
ncbi:winged helix-turn-helix transcriptional regulator [Haloterrigena salinisoli]|uniref:winged helix-turn-helix transcriptional regulator n=1 Tax=Haloterrigena salinisoli TaxID=3132747 RepID=UPI0030D004AC